MDDSVEVALVGKCGGTPGENYDMVVPLAYATTQGDEQSRHGGLAAYAHGPDYAAYPLLGDSHRLDDHLHCPDGSHHLDDHYHCPDGSHRLDDHYHCLDGSHHLGGHYHYLDGSHHLDDHLHYLDGRRCCHLGDCCCPDGHLYCHYYCLRFVRRTDGECHFCELPH